MLSTLVHIKDKNELKFIVPFVFHFYRKRVLNDLLTEAKCLEQLVNITNGGCAYSMMSPFL